MQYLKEKLIITILVLFLLVVTSTMTFAVLEVHFIDLGQGDSILVQTEEGKNMLIDGGDRWDLVADRLIDYLEEANVERIDAMVSTHPHADHIGGLKAVIKNFPVGRIYDSGRVHTTQTYLNYLELIDREDIPFYTPRRGEVIKLGSLNFDVLHPGSNVDDYNLNNASLVLHLTYGDISFLFAGDIEQIAEKEILDSNFNLKATVLKVPHHGSNSSTTPEFLDEVNPEVAIIQLGRDNRYGHPHQELIERLKEKSIDIYRTDRNGNVVIKTDGNDYEVSVEQDEIESKADSADKININTASKSDLEKLNGIGPAIAERIIEYRENIGVFKRIEDIKNVNGIGPARFERIRHDIII